MILTDVDRTIYISNLPSRATEELIYELFLQAGPLEGVSLKGGYGFVTYEHEESVLYACSLFEGTRLYGTEISIKPRQGSKFQDDHIKSYPPYVISDTNRRISLESRECEREQPSLPYLNRSSTSHSSYHGYNRPHQDDWNGYSGGSSRSSRDRSPIRFDYRYSSRSSYPQPTRYDSSYHNY